MSGCCSLVPLINIKCEISYLLVSAACCAGLFPAAPLWADAGSAVCTATKHATTHNCTKCSGGSERHRRRKSCMTDLDDQMGMAVFGPLPRKMFIFLVEAHWWPCPAMRMMGCSVARYPKQSSLVSKWQISQKFKSRIWNFGTYFLREMLRMQVLNWTSKIPLWLRREWREVFENILVISVTKGRRSCVLIPWPRKQMIFSPCQASRARPVAFLCHYFWVADAGGTLTVWLSVCKWCS